QSSGVDLGKNSRLVHRLRERFALANTVAHLPQDRAKFRGRGAVGEQIKPTKNRKARLDQRIELLVENEEVRATDMALAPTVRQRAAQATAWINRVNVQPPVHHFLARFIQRRSRLDV